MAAFAPAFGQSLRSRPPRNPNNQSNDSPRQLEFGKAMKDFKTMFPDLDDEVIEAVLRANNGLVDATIDQLLSMGAGDDNKTTGGFPYLPSYTDSGPKEPPPAYSPREEEPESSNFESRPLPARPYSNWNPPLLGNLPDDFLRLKHVNPASRTTTRKEPSPNSTTFTDRRVDREYEQFLEDEKLAKFLQNEEFVRELKHDRDFMMSLERDKQRSMSLNTNKDDVTDTPIASASSNKPSFDSEVHSSNPSSSDPADLSHLGAVGGGGGGHISSSSNQQNDDVVLREKLKHMGKSTRKKLDKMARIFHRKKTSQRANLITGGAASTANLLEEYEDDDDDELLNHMDSGRLEIMNGGGETDDNEMGNRNRGQATSKDSLEALDSHQVKKYDPIVFYAEDNEFQYKTEN